ncbi:MAG: type 1 glutamine amidotransferase [Boseongicola sp.]
MLIGILQCGHFVEHDGVPYRDYTQLYADLLDGHGFTFRGWDVVDMEFPDSIHQADGWLISGSKHGAYDDLPFIAPLEEFIRDAYAEDVPLVGICFGHQIMAQALGGKTEKFDGGWAVGHTDYDFGDASLALNAWHQDQVVTPPTEAETVASNSFCQHAALAYKGRAYSVQPHPEFDRTEIETLLELRAPGVVPEEKIETARTHLAKSNDNSKMANRIATFLKGENHV